MFGNHGGLPIVEVAIRLGELPFRDVTHALNAHPQREKKKKNQTRGETNVLYQLRIYR